MPQRPTASNLHDLGLLAMRLVLAAVFLFHGSATGFETSPEWVYESDQPEANLGWAVACAGDVNGDGLPDLIAGAIIFLIVANGARRILNISR